MSAVLQPSMKASDETPLLLERVSVSGAVHPALARIAMKQHYRNDLGRNVEAIYTFPLPPGAVLLRTLVELQGKRYEGVVLAKREAEGKYEEAIAEGNTAIMVERPEPGLYTMNVGNLMAGESITVEVEFAQLLDWNHGRMRLALPMTIAPRYGEERSALQPHQRPHIDVLVERPFELEIRVAVAGSVSSPSHGVTTRVDNGDLIVSLTRKTAWMDRDFVLMVQAADRLEPFCTVTRDGESSVGFLSFQVPEAPQDPDGRDVRIVVDCSGSMAGDSIALARKGAIELLMRLRPVDRFAIVAFGSSTKSFRSAVVDATEKNVEAGIAWVRGLAADMGGTELAAALEAVMVIRGSKGPAGVFLITDGQIGESEMTIDRARRLGHRIFVAAIGVSPSGGLLDGIVEATDGVIEYIGPNEDASETIGRQFARATQVPVRELSVDWGGKSEWSTERGSRALFSGDTVHVFSHVTTAPRSIRVSYQCGDSEPTALEVPCALSSKGLDGTVIPRLAAEKRIREGLRSRSMEPHEAERLAVQYQLVTGLTTYVLAVDRGEGRARDMPATIRVPEMLAAGWGGTGVVCQRLRSLEATAEHSAAYEMYASLSANLDIGRMRQAPDLVQGQVRFLDQANDRFGSLLSGTTLPLTRAAVGHMGLPPNVGDCLDRLISEGHSEEAVMRAFWAAFALFLDPSTTKRGLARKMKAVSKAADPELVRRILAELQAVEVMP